MIDVLADMAKPGLSDNEKRTLLGLVKYPTLNDRQLSEMIDIKMSTVTAIKNRLKDMGYFISVRVPKLQNMGAEMLTVAYAHTDPTVPHETQVEVGRSLIEEFDELFYVGAGPRYRFSMSMHRNYSSARQAMDGVLDLYSNRGFLIPGAYGIIHLPFDQTKVYNFFDHTRVLEQAFDLTLSDDEEGTDIHDGAFGTVKRAELSRIERKVLRGLTMNPDLLDSNISKRIDVTRQSVTKMRKRFQDLNLFFTHRIPNLDLLGFEILAFVHTSYKPASTLKDRAQPIAEIYDDLPIIFKADTDREGVEIVATRRYSDFERYFGTLVTHLRRQDAIERDPMVLLFTLDEFEVVKNHVYTPVLSSVVDPD
jgi:DNA-binding MarR family transcriptional regulator